MFTQNKDNFSEIVDIILYRYNSIDIRIWTLIKKTKDFRNLDSDSILVDVFVLKSILLNNFKNEINKFQAVESAMIYRDATSTYFIWKMIEDMQNLRWIKINLVKNAKYSRIIQTDEIKTIKFSIKILRGTFRTFDYFNKIQIPHINSILLRSGILKNSNHYGVVRLANMLTSLDIFLSDHNTSENAQVILPIIEVLEPYENDNPEVLIITDYESDI